MTIAVVLKIGDGIVMGADSAATLSAEGRVENIYFNAEKLFNLVKGWPIGVATYGLGGLDGRSIYNLAKELRERVTRGQKDWRLSRKSYTIEEAADRVSRFYHGEYYRREYPTSAEATDEYPVMGFIIAGYSARATQPEVWRISIGPDGALSGPTQVVRPDAGAVIFAEGQSEAAARVLRGWSPTVLEGLVDLGIPREEAEKFLRALPYELLIHPAMPLQDGIDLVRYVIDIQIGFVRFTPGAPTVSLPVDLAAITQHEGFRWIQRKHWYSSQYNLPRAQTKISE